MRTSSGTGPSTREGNLEPAKEVAFAIADIPASEVRDIIAKGSSWVPNRAEVEFGDTVTWHFDAPNETLPHDVWLLAPDTADPQTGAVQVSGVVPAGGPPASYTFRKQGGWTFVCKVHSTFNTESRQWSGMTGTVAVGEDPGTGEPGPGPGTNDPPVIVPPGPGPSGNPPLPPAPTATAAKLGKLPKLSLATFMKKGVRLSSACESGQKGRITVSLSKRQARKLGLKKATTLASKAIRCGSADKVTVKLTASKKLKKALKKARGSVSTTVKITMGSGRTATSNSKSLVLKKK